MILSNRKWRYVAAVVPALTLLTWWLFRPNPNVRKVRAILSAMTPEKMRDLPPGNRAAKGQELRDAVGKLTPEQRRDLFADGRKRFEESMKKYAKMSKEEKTRHLDEQINRTEQARQRNPGGSNPGGPRRGSTESDRKRRLDQSTPESRAAMDQFRKDMVSRRQQRGLPPGR
jgi:hypothetical protein